MDNVNAELIAATIAVLTALAGWLKSHSEVASVKADRERTRVERDTKIAILENELNHIRIDTTDLAKSIDELQKSIVSLQISVNKLLVEMEHKKQIR